MYNHYYTYIIPASIIYVIINTRPVSKRIQVDNSGKTFICLKKSGLYLTSETQIVTSTEKRENINIYDRKNIDYKQIQTISRVDCKITYQLLTPSKRSKIRSNPAMQNSGQKSLSIAGF